MGPVRDFLESYHRAEFHWHSLTFYNSFIELHGPHRADIGGSSQWILSGDQITPVYKPSKCSNIGHLEGEQLTTRSLGHFKYTPCNALSPKKHIQQDELRWSSTTGQTMTFAFRSTGTGDTTAVLCGENIPWVVGANVAVVSYGFPFITHMLHVMVYLPTCNVQ